MHLRSSFSSGSFQKGNLVTIRVPIIIDKMKRELESNWEGLFIIEKVCSNESYLLITIEGGLVILQDDARCCKSTTLDTNIHLQGILS